MCSIIKNGPGLNDLRGHVDGVRAGFASVLQPSPNGAEAIDAAAPVAR